jgi:hypothetical protein
MDTVEMMDRVDVVDLMVRNSKIIVKMEISRVLPAKLELEIVMYTLWSRIDG